MFERLIIAGVTPSLLLVQYRMHPQIAAFPSQRFYGGKIQVPSSFFHVTFFIYLLFILFVFILFFIVILFYFYLFLLFRTECRQKIDRHRQDSSGQSATVLLLLLTFNTLKNVVALRSPFSTQYVSS